MEFNIKRTKNPNIEKCPKETYDIALEFSNKLYKEFGTFLRAAVLFGAAARGTKKPHDIDLLLIVDDTQIQINAEVVEAYRIITEKLVLKTNPNIHVTTLKFSTFWDYVRTSDPIAVNILRDGVALFDTGFFDPLQLLLYQGKIRPSFESIWAYYSRAPRSIFNSKWHIMQGILDLYWSVIDSAHAALMKEGYVPPTPAHVADFLDKYLVKEKKMKIIIEKK